MPEGMRCHWIFDSSSLRGTFDDLPNALPTQTLSLPVEKKGRFATSYNKSGSRSHEVIPTCPSRMFTNWDHTLLSPFTRDPKKVCARRLANELAHVKGNAFGNSHSGTVERFQDCTIPDSSDGVIRTFQEFANGFIRQGLRKAPASCLEINAPADTSCVA
jgi:hypothetical protein